MRAHASTARAIDTLTNECEEAEQGIRLVAVSAGEAIPVGWGAGSPRRTLPGC
jgi:hypothetical protein